MSSIRTLLCLMLFMAACSCGKSETTTADASSSPAATTAKPAPAAPPAGLNDTPEQKLTRKDFLAAGFTALDAVESGGRVFPGSDSQTIAILQKDKLVAYRSGKPFAECPGNVMDNADVVWSADGSTIAVVSTTSLETNNQKLYINGREYAAGFAIRNVTLSRDGKRVAYVASVDRGSFGNGFIDGKDQGQFFSITEFAFSADGKTAIMLAAKQQPLFEKDPGGFDVYVNGQTVPAHFRSAGHNVYDNGLGSIAVSPDGKRWAVRGQVFGPETPQAGGVGGFAVMVDGKMGPTFGDVVEGTLQFTPDSRDVLYAAGSPSGGDYAVYRNHQPGRQWDYIAPKSLKPLRGGKSVAYIAHEAGPSRFTAFDPVPGRQPRQTGVPLLAIDDRTVFPSCGNNSIVSEDGQHTVVVSMSMPNPMNGPMTFTLQCDAKPVGPVPAEAKQVELRYSPDCRHWFAFINDRFSQSPAVYIDGKGQSLPPEVYFLGGSIDNNGVVRLMVLASKSIWWLTSK